MTFTEFFKKYNAKHTRVTDAYYFRKGDRVVWYDWFTQEEIFGTFVFARSKFIIEVENRFGKVFHLSPVSDDIFSLEGKEDRSREVKCECGAGADKTFGNFHSSYCPMFNLEKDNKLKGY